MKRYCIDDEQQKRFLEIQAQVEAKIKDENMSPYEAKLARESFERKAFSNAIISSQSLEMKAAIAKHDPKFPIIITGPHVVVVKGIYLKYYQIESAGGGELDLEIYEDPDQYKVVTYDKWWRNKDTHIKQMFSTASNLQRINSIQQKMLPGLGHTNLRACEFYEGHSQRKEIRDFEEPYW